MNKILIYLLLFILFSCKEEVYVTPPPQVEEIGQAPETFEIQLEKVTDTKITIKWTDAVDPEGEIVTYEVTLFDSVVAYNLSNKYYIIDNLFPETEYKIGVNALDQNYNKTSTSLNVKTFGRLLRSTYWLDLGFHFDYRFTQAINLNDKGILLAGDKFEVNGIQFLAKLNDDFEIQWVKEYDWDYTDNINKLIQLKDGTFVIIRKSSVTKIDNHGNIIWQYISPYENIHTTINSGTELEDGSIAITGTTNVNIEDTYPTNLKAFITKISKDGQEIWHKYYGDNKDNRAEEIVQNKNGDLSILGTSTFQFSNVFESDDCFWFLLIDQNGKIKHDTIYENKYVGSDVINNLYVLENNSLLLCGSTWSGFGGFYEDSRPRILKVNNQGNIEWDLYPEISGLGYFASFDGMIDFSDQMFSFFSNLDRGVYIGESNMNGVITYDLKLRNFPSAMFMIKNKANDFLYFTTSGYIFVLNPNGYVE